MVDSLLDGYTVVCLVDLLVDYLFDYLICCFMFLQLLVVWLDGLLLICLGARLVHRLVLSTTSVVGLFCCLMWFDWPLDLCIGRARVCLFGWLDTCMIC